MGSLSDAMIECEHNGRVPLRLIRGSGFTLKKKVNTVKIAATMRFRHMCPAGSLGQDSARLLTETILLSLVHPVVTAPGHCRQPGALPCHRDAC